MQRLFLLAAFLTILAMAFGAGPAQHGLVGRFLVRDGRPVFPIGIYEMPKTDAELQAMTLAGIDLVRCGSKEDLDRARAAGMMGWVPLPLDAEDPARVRRLVESVKNHPALAAWEGPDELVWNFTANSDLYRRGVYKVSGEWWKQTPEAIEYSETQAHKIIPQLHANIRLLRQLDGGRHPLWINEAAGSDLKFIREYIDAVDITGCDTYPIHEGKRHPTAAGDYTDRYRSVGENRPVWMVLQGFAWHDLHIEGKTEKAAYPSFAETRLMAYDALAHAASALLYWGTAYIPPDTGAEFRSSIYAITREVSKLQPFLTAPEEKSARVALTETTGRAEPGDRGVRIIARRAGSDWLIVLVNEDDHPHMGVEVEGLSTLTGRQLQLLYGTEAASIRNGEFITRLMPQEVKVFATSRKWETALPDGRSFADADTTNH
jgi:hypothetical protein